MEVINFNFNEILAALCAMLFLIILCDSRGAFYMKYIVKIYVISQALKNVFSSADHSVNKRYVFRRLQSTASRFSFCRTFELYGVSLIRNKAPYFYATIF